MNELTLFKFENNGIRSLLVNNEPYFVGNDIAKTLGYSNPRDALSKHVDQEDKIPDVAIHDGSQKRNMTIINESGVYSLVFGSKLPSAKRFKHWVTSEVLPQLRKTGKYAVRTDRQTELAKAVLMANEWIQEQQKQIEAQAKQLEEQRPKVTFADSVVASDGSILVRELAKMIRQNGHEMGQNKLYKWFRENGFICKNSTEPTQKAMNMGLFEIMVRTIQRGDGTSKETRTTKVTGKGQVYFISRLCTEQKKHIQSVYMAQYHITNRQRQKAYDIEVSIYTKKNHNLIYT